VDYRLDHGRAVAFLEVFYQGFNFQRGVFPFVVGPIAEAALDYGWEGGFVRGVVVVGIVLVGEVGARRCAAVRSARVCGGCCDVREAGHGVCRCGEGRR